MRTNPKAKTCSRKSQDRIADSIKQFLIENDKSNRKVIGIEGEWGSGKSNVIEILRDKLKNDYYFFVFDAWGHQEDLTRRSILQGLLSKLIEGKIVREDKKRYWEQELKNLLSKKVEKQQMSIPKSKLRGYFISTWYPFDSNNKIYCGEAFR